MGATGCRATAPRATSVNIDPNRSAIAPRARPRRSGRHPFPGASGKCDTSVTSVGVGICVKKT